MSEEELPMEWNAWRAEWNAWRNAHNDALKPTSWRFPGQNMLADEKLGTWNVNRRNVELSEVTMPVLSDRERNRRGDRVRYVGVTFGIGADGDSCICATWDELEIALGLGVSR